MTTRIADMSPQKTARVAGLLYLSVWAFVFIAGYFLYAPSLTAAEDAAVIDLASVRVGFVSDLIHHSCFLLLAWALYVLFKPVNRNLALLFVLCVVVTVAIQCINTLNVFTGMRLLNGADYLTAFEADQVHALAMFYLDLHHNGVLIAQIFFGGWLLPLGYLVFKSGYVPRIIGVLLMIGCCGYLLDVFVSFLFPSYDVITFPGLAVATIAEFLFPVWLLVKGVTVLETNNKK